MSSREFIGEVNRRHISAECREQRHDDCTGYVQKKEWTDHEYSCDCLHHQPDKKADRIARAIARSGNKIEPEE